MADIYPQAERTKSTITVTCSRDKRELRPEGQKKGHAVANALGKEKKGQYRCSLCGAEFTPGSGSHPLRKAA